MTSFVQGEPTAPAVLLLTHRAGAPPAPSPSPAPPSRVRLRRRAATQALTELQVSLHRLTRFLHTRETPPVTSSLPNAAPPCAAAPAHAPATPPPGTLVLAAACYDWSRPFGGAEGAPTGLGVPDPAELKGKGGAAGAGAGEAPAATAADGQARAFTLTDVEFVLRPGELLGVCGEVRRQHCNWCLVCTACLCCGRRPPASRTIAVRRALLLLAQVGAGKSTLLAALLGELLPVSVAECEGGAGEEEEEEEEEEELVRLAAGSERGVLVVGSLAYCAQVSGTSPV